MGRVEGKVALITGAARGQGRSHAVRLAEEGADIIAIDSCQDLSTVLYPLAQPEDLKETARLVEAHNRRVVTVQADVRDRGQLDDAVARGVRELGRLDVVVAQAGILSNGGQPSRQAWADVVDVNLIGAVGVVHAALPHLGEGASIILTGSVAAFMNEPVGADPGGAGYTFAKHALAHYVHAAATALASQSIRVNAIHPTNCNTTMLHNDVMYGLFRPDLESPTRTDAELAFPAQQRMPIGYVEPNDISHAVVYLASEEARYVTGMQMRVDAGAYLNFRQFHN